MSYTFNYTFFWTINKLQHNTMQEDAGYKVREYVGYVSREAQDYIKHEITGPSEGLRH